MTNPQDPSEHLPDPNDVTPPALPRFDRRSEERPDSIDRRRPGWQSFRAAYPGLVKTMALALLLAAMADTYLIYKRFHYTHEIARLRGGMTTAERKRADLLVNNEQDKFKLMVELVRRQAQGDKELHLSISSDSATMYLQREGALLRQMPVEVGPEKSVGIPPDTVRLARPRGERTVEQILEGGVWEVPTWVYADRGLPVPADRHVKGALGAHAILLSGGTVVYSLPTTGPLADSSYILPGSVRARTADLAAIVPNMKPGVAVYFY